MAIVSPHFFFFFINYSYRVIMNKSGAVKTQIVAVRMIHAYTNNSYLFKPFLPTFGVE